MYDSFDTQILVASVRSPAHVVEAAKLGADVCTIPPAIIKQLFQHPLTDKGLAQFVADWAKTGQTIPRATGAPKKTGRAVTGPAETGPASRKRTGATAAIDETTETAIAAYLKAHPDFVQRHPAVLRSLTPPAQDRGEGVVDFQRYMVSRLQNDIGALSVEKTALIQTARLNANGQARIHAAVLALVEARSLGQMLETLTGDLLDILDVDVIAMAVESNGVDVPHVAASGIRIVEPGSVAGWLGRREVLLQGPVTGDPEIYGAGAGLIQSEALLRLNISSRTPQGLVAFGSRDPALFQDGQGTELVAFLGAVLERLLRGWLDLPS